MRVAATLLVALLLGTSAAVAQDEAPPSAGSLDPVCEYLFSLASGTETSPTPVGSSSLLDMAVRSCADVEDFMRASALHPGALGDIDPLVFLAARCRDELADLARHATCASLERALATPASNAAPVATPPPTPAPTPQRTPPADEGQGSEGLARPRLVRLPRIAESVPGATKVRYFKVAARSAEELLRGTLEGARRHCPSHGAAACVRLRPRLQPRFLFDGGTGVCRVVEAVVSTKAVVFLPRWTKPARVPPELLAWWRKVSRHFAWHERQHIRIQQQYNAVLRKRLRGKPCSAVQRVITRWSRQSQRAQEAFDRRDQRWQVPDYDGPWR